KVHRCRGCKPHPATLAPAGSTRGGEGGNEWSEALREKVPSGDQRAMRAAATANIDEASKRSAVRADPPVEWGGRRRRTSERETPPTVSPGERCQHAWQNIGAQQGKSVLAATAGSRLDNGEPARES